MPRKMRFILVVGLVLIVAAELSAWWLVCGSPCQGSCGCQVLQGEHGGSWGSDPCCFYCSHWAGDLVCCQGISPADGCVTPQRY